MTDEAKSVPLRIRVTPSNRSRYEQAMRKLGYTKLSTFARWALENSTQLVLNATSEKVSPTQFTQVDPMHARRAPNRRTPAPAAPPPQRTSVQPPAPPPPPPPPQRPPLRVVPDPVPRLTLEEMFGVPFSQAQPEPDNLPVDEGPVEAPIVDGDDWM